MYSIEPDDLVELQTLWLRDKVSRLVDRIPVLKRLADAQRIKEITSIDDGAPLLFAHSVYKSYPLSALDNGDFGRLTRWLDNLTTHDLSGLDTSACETIDDWVDALEEQTELRIIHSSGTTGKLSFLPRSASEMVNMARAWAAQYTGFGDEPDNPPRSH